MGVQHAIWNQHPPVDRAFDPSHLDLLRKIKEAGFDGVEISRFDFKEFPAAKSAAR